MGVKASREALGLTGGVLSLDILLLKVHQHLSLSNLEVHELFELALLLSLLFLASFRLVHLALFCRSTLAALLLEAAPALLIEVLCVQGADISPV